MAQFQTLISVRFEYFEAVGSAIAGFGVTRADSFVGRATKAIAAKADAVIICVGFDPKTESEGADRTFQLPGGQDELIRQISSVNKNTIVVITAGGNVDMTQWVDRVPAILLAWYPGQEGGTALAQILLGDYSPSGKLPVSLERRWEDNPTFHSYYPEKGESRVQYSEGVFVGTGTLIIQRRNRCSRSVMVFPIRRSNTAACPSHHRPET